MTTYQKRPTQEGKILAKLRERGSRGLYAYEICMPVHLGGLGILQYNARIYGLRKKGHKIENVRKGLFVLEEK